MELTADAVSNTQVGVAVDGAGNVYVLDAGTSRIQKFSPSGELIARWGFEGSGEAQPDRSVGVSVDGAGNVYLLDAGSCRVQKYTPSGMLVGAWGFGASAEASSGDAGPMSTDDGGARRAVQAPPPVETTPAPSVSPVSAPSPAAPVARAPDTIVTGVSSTMGASAARVGEGVDTAKSAAAESIPAVVRKTGTADAGPAPVETTAPGDDLKRSIRSSDSAPPARRPWWQFWK